MTNGRIIHGVKGRHMIQASSEENLWSKAVSLSKLADDLNVYQSLFGLARNLGTIGASQNFEWIKIWIYRAARRRSVHRS